MIIRSAAFILLSLILYITSYAQPAGDALTVFTVARKPVTADEFIYLYKKNHQNKPDEFTTEKIEEYLNLFINFKLKVTEAQKRGIDTTQAFRNEFNTYKEELRKPYLPDSRLLDSLVRLTYDRMKEEISASHILINVAPDAQEADTLKAYNKILELRERALKGESFEALAETNSNDPSSKVNKGNLGYFTALQMVYPFETAAYSTKKGDVSMPVRTNFGYHIIKVNDRRPAQGEVEVSHIMVRTGENKDNEQSKEAIFQIYEQLRKGVDWNDLVKEKSEDPASKDQGGRLRPFGVGVMGAVPEFEKAAFELKEPGDFSDPFQTQFGWHIVKLERKIPLPSFEEMSASLKGRVSRDERVQVSKQALYEKIRKEYGYLENTSTKTSVFSLADTTVNNGNWKPAVNRDEILFTLDGKNFSSGDFLDYVQKKQQPNSQNPAGYVEELFNAFVEEQLVAALERKITEQSPDYRWLLKEYYEGILLFDIMEKEVWNKASEDSVGQRKYFDQHAAEYKAGERIKGRIYSSTTKAHIDELKPLLEENDSARIANLVSTYRIKHEQGSFEKEDRIVLDKITWAPGIYSAQNNNLHYIIAVDNIIPPGPKTFDEARPEVISDYQNWLEKKWVEELKKKYPVKINKKGKSFVMKQLVTTGAK